MKSETTLESRNTVDRFYPNKCLDSPGSSARRRCCEGLSGNGVCEIARHFVITTNVIRRATQSPRQTCRSIGEAKKFVSVDPPLSSRPTNMSGERRPSRRAKQADPVFTGMRVILQSRRQPNETLSTDRNKLPVQCNMSGMHFHSAVS